MCWFSCSLIFKFLKNGIFKTHKGIREYFKIIPLQPPFLKSP
ncbi:hypothetical protein HPHPH21_0298 [Helicobacter pylori Hp H-21]|nr:hypothetical protein HPHPH21_0298 [Helicobacter pylori Hp H-21]